MFHRDLIDKHMVLFEATEKMVKATMDAGWGRERARNFVLRAGTGYAVPIRAALFDMLWPGEQA